MMLLFSSDLSAQCDCNNPSILYAPSADDDPAWRAEIAAAIGSATVTYLDARVTTPTVVQMSDYCAVITWTNEAYANHSDFGDNLADYVDGGGQVILGVFSTFTQGISLTGRIMTVGYSPVASPLGANTGVMSSYSNDGSPTLFRDVNSLSAPFQDVLVMQGDGILDGTYENGEVLSAYRPDFGVVYLNGMSSRNFMSTMDGDWDILVRNAFRNNCPVIIPTLSEWMVVILGLMLLTVGILVVRSRSLTIVS